MYKIKNMDYVNLYLIKFDNPIDLESTNSVEFEYNDEEYKNKINELINDIYVYPIVLNKLVCVNFNLGLKYLDGKINTQFNEQEQIIINKYSGNIDLLADVVMLKFKTTNKIYYDHNKINIKKLVYEYIE